MGGKNSKKASPTSSYDKKNPVTKTTSGTASGSPSSGEFKYKLGLVGESGVGKSCCLLRFTENEFFPGVSCYMGSPPPFCSCRYFIVSFALM